VKIVDLGEMFGYPTAKILYPWNPDQVVIDSLNSANEKLDGVDLVMFGGGADIHPSLYNHCNVASNCGRSPSKRDLFEREIFKLCRDLRIPMLGICRGSQFLCAMSGGALIQDCSGHAIGEFHPITTNDGQELYMTSTHHQMMYPNRVKHELIAWANSLAKANFEWDFRAGNPETNKDGWIEKEPEIVYFPTTNALAVQGHPEYFADVMAPPVKFIRDLISTRLFNEERNIRG